MGLKHSIRAITDLKTKTAELVRGAARGQTYVITQNGEAKAVLMDVAIYDEWKHGLGLVRLLSLAATDVAKGRVVSNSEAKRRFRTAAKRHHGR